MYSFNVLALFIGCRCNKGKEILLQDWTSPEGSGRFRRPEFMTIGTWRWQVFQL